MLWSDKYDICGSLMFFLNGNLEHDSNDSLKIYVTQEVEIFCADSLLCGKIFILPSTSQPIPQSNDVSSTQVKI